MKKILYQLIMPVCISVLWLPVSLRAQAGGYSSPGQVDLRVADLVKRHPGKVRSTVLATTPGRSSVTLIEIGNETASEAKSHPAIFVVANLEGTRPLATEGALFLAEQILSDPEHHASVNWYIIPSGNPDAARHFFLNPLVEDSGNGLPTNDDRDDLTDEDGTNDLNKDGWITQMRVREPVGAWIVSEEDPRLMRKADPAKGEQGIYTLYSEGLDDDGDGKYNEDGPGGTNVGINFPFLFKFFTAEGGIYPGSTPESYAIMDFVFGHPDIAMIFSFGSTGFCLTPPRGGRRGEANMSSIRVPPRQAAQFGLDPSRTYSMEELVELLNAAMPGMNIDASMIAGFLGLGAAVNPQPADLVFYNKFATDYKAYLKKQGVTAERFDPDPAKDGSLELWGYFHVGVPVFSMDLWGIPKSAKDSAQARTSPSAAAMAAMAAGGARQAAASGSGEGKDDLEKEKALIAFSDSLLDGKGFVNWEPYDHPTLGQVEIGGFVPYTATTPPFPMVDSLLALQVPWVLDLAGELPRLSIYETKVTPKGSGIYQLEAWIENSAFISFPTAMGKRNRQPAPAVVTVAGEQLEFLSGYERTPVREVDGKSRVKLTWILQTRKPADVTLKLESKNAGSDQQSIKIGG